MWWTCTFSLHVSVEKWATLVLHTPVLDFVLWVCCICMNAKFCTHTMCWGLRPTGNDSLCFFSHFIFWLWQIGVLVCVGENLLHAEPVLHNNVTLWLNNHVKTSLSWTTLSSACTGREATAWSISSPASLFCHLILVDLLSVKSVWHVMFIALLCFEASFYVCQVIIIQYSQMFTLDMLSVVYLITS